MIKVEKGVPIPPRRWRGGGPRGGDPKYPWPLMEVGDSFFIPTHSRDEAILMNLKIGSSATTYMRKHGVKFTARSLDDGVRYWRVK